MSKIILTDIDDTILEFAVAFETWAVTKKGYTLTGKSVRETGSIQDAIGCDRELVDALVTEFSENPEHFKYLKPESDAKAVIPVLHKMGYEFVAISSCINGPEVVSWRRFNLEQAFGIPWLEVRCMGLLQPKKAVLAEFEPTWWIEDNAGHAIAGAELGHQTILLERNYNNTFPNGTVKWYSQEQKAGFITPDMGGDIFVRDVDDLTEGQKVSFNLKRRESGMMQAVSVVRRAKSWHNVLDHIIRSDVREA